MLLIATFILQALFLRVTYVEALDNGVGRTPAMGWNRSEEEISRIAR